MNTISTLSGEEKAQGFSLGREKTKSGEFGQKLEQENNLLGTSFVAGLVCVKRNGLLYFLFIRQRWQGQVNMKFPGGTSQPGEEPYVTLCRELQGETGLVPGQAYRVLSEMRTGYNNRPFSRIFYLVTSFTGELLTQARDVGHAEHDPEIVEPPFWLELNRALINKIHHSHRKALFFALSFLCYRDREAAWLIDKAKIVVPDIIPDCIG